MRDRSRLRIKSRYIIAFLWRKLGKPLKISKSISIKMITVSDKCYQIAKKYSKKRRQGGLKASEQPKYTRLCQVGEKNRAQKKEDPKEALNKVSFTINPNTKAT